MAKPEETEREQIDLLLTLAGPSAANDSAESLKVVGATPEYVSRGIRRATGC